MNKEDVKYVVHETLSGLGFTIDDPNEIQQDIIYLRKIRTSSEGMKGLVRGTFITVIVTFLLQFIYFKVRS